MDDRRWKMKSWVKVEAIIKGIMIKHLVTQLPNNLIIFFQRDGFGVNDL
jgi:hypothetical protein